MSDLDFSEVYSRLDLGALLPDLEPRDKGEYFELRCPSCQERSAFLYKGKSRIECNRKNNCAFDTTIWSQLLERNGGDKRKTLEELAQVSGVALPQDGKPEEVHLNARRREDLFSQAHALLIQELSKNQTGSDYLTRRGYGLEDIKAMGLGLFPSFRTITKNLTEKGFAAEEIEALGLFPEFEGRIAIPLRDANDRLKGFAGRSISNETEPKYLYPKGFRRNELIGFHRAKSQTEIVIVEGMFDVLYAHARDFPQVVATGSSSLGKEQLESLAALKKPILFCFDNDEAGRRGTQKAIKRCLNRGLAVFACNLPAHVKDLDELLRSAGEEIFPVIIEQAKRHGSGARFLARTICEAHDLTSDLEKGKAVSEALKACVDIASTVERDHFTTELSELTSLPKNELETEAKAHLERAKLEDLLKRRESLPGDIKELLEGKGLPEGLQLAKGLTEGLWADYESLNAHTLTFADFLSAKEERDSNREPGKLLGYDLNKFPKLATKIDGIQAGLIIIAASTNVGKTALLSNIALDLISSNPEVRVLYFSLDDSKSTITNRLLGGLSALPLNSIQRGITGQETIEAQTKLDNAYRMLGEYGNDGRLDIVDLAQLENANALEGLVRRFGTQNLILCVDGLHNFPAEAAFIREANIQRANLVKRLADIFEIPVIVTTELRKKTGNADEPGLDEISETSKYSYNANTIILLWSDSDETERTEILLNARVAKNKLSDFRGTLKFTFYRDQSRIIEQTGFGELAANNRDNKNGTQIAYSTRQYVP